MKQTNNAIKFLMAQYRAIFRNANLKMFLAAATAAAALSAGQAQAAGTVIDSWEKLETGDYNNGDASADDKKIAISGGTEHQSGFNVVITAGAGTIEGKKDQNALTVATDKPSSITLRASDNANTLTIGKDAADGHVSVSIDTFNNEQGKLVLVGSGDAAQTVLNAKNITIGKEDGKAAVVEIGKHSSLGGTDSSSLEIVSGGEVKFNDATSVATAAQGVHLNGGKISATAGKIVGGLRATSGEVAIGDGNAAGTLTIESGNATFEGKASFNNANAGSKLILNGDVTFEAESIKANTGTIDFGTLKADETRTLTVDAADWDKLFAATGKVSGEGAAGATLLVDVKNASDTNAVNLGTLVKTAADDTNGNLTDKIALKTAGTVKVQAATAKLENTVLNAANAAFDIGTLTVGKDDTGTFDLKAGSLSVGTKLAVTQKTGADDKDLSITAKGALTLDAKDPTGKAKGTIDAKTVTVNATDATDNALNIKNGTWSTTGALTVTKGTVNVSNATLNLGGKLSVAATDGKLKADASVVDTTKGDFDLKASTVELGNTSTLVLNADKLFKIDETSKELTVDNGVFTAKAVTAASNSKISLKPSSGTEIELTKEQYQKLLEGTGFNGVFSGLKITGIETKPGEMDIGGDGIISGIDGKYDQNVGKTDSAISGGTYDMGAVKVSGESLSLGAGGNLILVNANANGGNFVSGTKDGNAVVGNVSLADAAGNGLTLGGSGKIGSITTENDGKGSVTFGEAKTETNPANIGNVTVEGSIGTGGATAKALDAVVVNGSQVSVHSGDVYTQNLMLNGGSLSLDEGKSLVLGNGVTPSAGGTGDLASSIEGNLTVDKFEIKANTAGSLNIAGGAEVNLGSFKGTEGTTVTVGNDVDKNGTASVYADTMMLENGSLFVDPAYGQHYARVVVGNFTNDASSQTDDYSAGLVKGKIYIGPNAAVGVGFSSKEELDKNLALFLNPETMSFADPAQDAKGSANALVLNKGITLGAQDGIYVGVDADPNKPNDNKVTFGANSALVITDNAFGVGKTGAAIKTDTGANVAVNDGAKILLVGDFNAKDDALKIFSGSTANPTIGTSVSVKSANGLLSGSWTGGTVNLDIDPAQRDKLFLDASAPVRQLLLDKAEGVLDSGSGLGWDFIGKHASSSISGAVVDAAAHAATYAGAQVAAVAAVGTMAEAVGGRVGSMGVEATAITATGSQANGGVWLSPMYKSVDADGFNAQGGSYGADVDLAGVAFGADTVNGNMRFGAVFNIGSGDADGKGNGNGLNDEFDYYGFGIYSVMGFGQLAIVGDASLNVISHEVEGLELKGSADTTAVTMGVTGQYSISTPAVDVTPHLGARFIRLDTDSYDLMSAEGPLATTDFDVQNVFSIPLGVTLSKAFEMGGWSLAPNADFSITFNTGDTEAKSTTQFTGVKAIGLSTEVLDEVTYGVAVGLGAQYGAFGTNIGINYTGSENTDSFGVNAQARYMF